MSEERGEWTGLTFEGWKAAVEVIGVIVADWDAGIGRYYQKPIGRKGE